MKKIIFSFAIAIFLVNFVFLNTASAEFKKTKIAVLDFQLQGEGYETSDMGKIVAEWLITALVKEGRFDVIERMLLKKVLDEQRLGVSGIIDESSASKLGRVLGAKIVITGSIMKFQNVMEVNARIIEVESSSIIAAENVKSTSAVKLEDLVVKMAEKIIKDFPLEGYIAQRKENRVLIDLGKRAGVKTGMQFIVFKEGMVIKHPKTGEVLDVERIETGSVEIKDVKDKTADALIIKENSPAAIEVGQMVKSTVELIPDDVLPPDIDKEFEKPSRKAGRERERAIPVDAGILSQLQSINQASQEMKQLRESDNRAWKRAYKNILSNLKSVMRRNKRAPEVYLSYAKAYYAADELSSAEKFLKKTFQLRPMYLEAHIFRGDMYYDLAKKLEPDKRRDSGYDINARDSYQKVLSATQDKDLQALMYYRIGNIYADLAGDKENARENWQKAVAISPGSNAASSAKERLRSK
ncbi:MAG: FlgO family outer membrane protein [Thermodesulfovibrionales bacterium]|nr:FlgO family outer membrane protein [Thermodesulfovibrionales bacterium]MDP3113111.1 FlgO family outer membrane protein [Thermodesulfovibrionales bacterium]